MVNFADKFYGKKKKIELVHQFITLISHLIKLPFKYHVGTWRANCLRFKKGEIDKIGCK